MPRRPRLVVMTGLPATGKTAVAEGIARAAGWPLVAKDVVEASMYRHGIRTEHGSGAAAYEAMTALAAEQLRLGVSVILDSVATTGALREQWRSVADEHGAEWKVIECVCPDEMLHRHRLEGRDRGIPGWYELTWDQVQEVAARYEPWGDESRLVLDATAPLSENLQTALRWLAIRDRGSAS